MKWALGKMTLAGPRTLSNNMHENREILDVLGNQSRPIREGFYPGALLVADNPPGGIFR